VISLGDSSAKGSELGTAGSIASNAASVPHITDTTTHGLPIAVIVMAVRAVAVAAAAAAPLSALLSVSAREEVNISFSLISKSSVHEIRPKETALLLLLLLTPASHITVGGHCAANVGAGFDRAMATIHFKERFDVIVAVVSDDGSGGEKGEKSNLPHSLGY